MTLNSEVSRCAVTETMTFTIIWLLRATINECVFFSSSKCNKERYKLFFFYLNKLGQNVVTSGRNYFKGLDRVLCQILR